MSLNPYSWPQSTYRCRVQSCVWRLPKYWPPTPRAPSPPSECVLPPHQRWGAHTRRAVRGWRGNILEDARHRIGLLQYNLSTCLTQPWPHTALAQCRYSVGSNHRESTLWVNRINTTCTTLRGVYVCMSRVYLANVEVRVEVTLVSHVHYCSHEVFWTVEDNCTRNPCEQLGHLYSVSWNS